MAVRFFEILSIAAWTILSLLTSIALVASSKTMI
jgi:hypothetical protein